VNTLTWNGGSSARPTVNDHSEPVVGVYYGRSGTGKCRLSDQQVERLMREREQQRHGVGDGLRALIAADPYQGVPGISASVRLRPARRAA